MKAIVVKSSQRGAALSFEYAILIILGASSAVALLMLATPTILNFWNSAYSQVQTDAMDTMAANIQYACLLDDNGGASFNTWTPVAPPGMGNTENTYAYSALNGACVQSGSYSNGPAGNSTIKP